MVRLRLAAARAALAALAALATAARAHYADYSSGNLPHYGVAADYEGPRDSNAADEYHDPHPQDVSMALDYNKFADDPIGSYKSKSKEATAREFEETDIWQESEKNEKRLSRSEDIDNNHDNFHKYRATENIQNFAINERMPKGPLRHKTRSIDDVEDHNIQNQGDKYNMRSIKDTEGSHHFKSQEGSLEEKTNQFKGRNWYRNKENIFRAKVRRKPRDKIDKGIVDNPPPIDENELALFKKFVKENRKDIDYPIDVPGRMDLPGGMDLPNLPKDMDYPVDVTGIDLPRRLSAVTRDANKMKINKPQTYRADYDEYYDMKRVNSIKEKLPGLLQRSTGDGAEMTEDEQFPSTELVRDDILWANRRMVPDPEILPTTRATTSSTESSTATTTAVEITTTVSTTTTEITSTLSKDELSLAEKSRLSILKKAQRKESFGNSSSTSKPPVLLQVASKAQTLVMVEPPTSPDPLFRAREIPEDSPERLNLVKRMMRHKLVAGARSIRDLTDNWDEMVCDYVDMSLLENAAKFKCNSAVLLNMTIILLILMIVT